MSLIEPGTRPSYRPLFDLRRYGDAPALVLGDRILTYAGLDDLVQARAARLGTTRRLVLIECANDLEPLVTYLAALAGGHPAMLVPARTGAAADQQWERLVACYDPDVVLHAGSDGWTLHEVRAGTAHDLHPDLALLLGTSGSTGTPKLVRLSRDNLASNADAIADYLRLDGDSRAATTLPMQYCYGLSVINSHLHAGGSLWLTSQSVVDPGFWADFRRAGATSFAGVPYTFDLLEQSGADWTTTGGLRQVTQAGGALPAERVRDLARRTSAKGVELFVMYGATEATARMAYLPPAMAVDRAGTIGVPIEGGEFTIHDGELVYSGPNVMLGYAESPDDLALGRTVTSLRTGDLAVQHDDGLYEITGRCNRIAKLFGTRLDLDLVERLLRTHSIEARATATSSVLTVFVRDAEDVGQVTALVTGQHCLPAHAVRVRVVEELPVTSSGKPDYAALARLDEEESPLLEDVPAVFSAVLGVPVSGHDSFVSLGGDSLSYVEMSVRLEALIGALPADWPQRSIASLSGLRPRPRRWWAALETPVLLRALAIVLIVGSHTELFDLMGGAHVLLALVGFNLGRFALRAPSRVGRLRSLGSGLRDVLVPSVVWIGAVAVVAGKYDLTTVLLVNDWLGTATWSAQWQFWFLEVVAWGSLAIGALLAVPAIDRLQRRSPYSFALGLLALTLALRFSLTGLQAGRIEVYSLGTAAWCLVLGWLIAVTVSRSQRLLTTALAAACVLGYFGDARREYVVVAGLLAMLWLPRVLVPRLLVRPISLVGAASLFIYLTQWVVYPPLDADHDFWAAVAALVVGVLVHQLWSRGLPVVRRWGGSMRRPRHANVAGGDGRTAERDPMRDIRMLECADAGAPSNPRTPGTHTLDAPQPTTSSASKPSEFSR